MAKVITTTEISFHIERLIKNAEEFIFIVTPFIKIHKRLKSLLREKLKAKKIHLFVVCRELSIDAEELTWLKSLTNCHLFFHENLHAKSYFNEQAVVITSMNLYSFSMVNNIEFGVLIEKELDESNYEIILKECDLLIDNQRQICKELSQPTLRVNLAEALKKAGGNGPVA